MACCICSPSRPPAYPPENTKKIASLKKDTLDKSKIKNKWRVSPLRRFRSLSQDWLRTQDTKDTFFFLKTNRK
jgi:hypothetical protein